MYTLLKLVGKLEVFEGNYVILLKKKKKKKEKYHLKEMQGKYVI